MLRLVKDKNQLYSSLKVQGLEATTCRVWQPSEAGRVSLESSATIDPSIGSVKLKKLASHNFNLTEPCYFYLEKFDFAFKSQLDSNFQAFIPEVLCSTERRKEGRLNLKKGTFATIISNGKELEVEVHDLSQKGFNFRVTELPFSVKSEITITKITGYKKELNLKAHVKHATKFAIDPQDGTNPEALAFFFSVGAELKEAWPFEALGDYDPYSEKAESKEKLFNMCMLSASEQKMMDHEIEQIEKKLKNSKQFSHLLKAYTAQKENAYLKWHTDVASVLSITAARKLDWISEATIKKFILACYLHDLIFAEYPKLSEIQNKAEFELLQGQMSEKEIFLFLNHTKLSSSLANEQMNLSGDVEKILSQQKELPDGTGYPLGINHLKITPLSSLFIICHEIAHHLYFNEEPSMKKYCLSLREKYKGQTFYKVTNALLEIFPN